MATYYQVYEYRPDKTQRLIYTFEREEDAHDLVEFIMSRDLIENCVGVEEYETPT